MRRLPRGSHLKCFTTFVTYVCAAIDSRFFERVVQQPPGRADERMARQVFLVARLFADEHDARADRAFAENRLRPALPKVAGAASGRRVVEFGQSVRPG